MTEAIARALSSEIKRLSQALKALQKVETPKRPPSSKTKGRSKRKFWSQWRKNGARTRIVNGKRKFVL